jgi:hypothetical protein
MRKSEIMEREKCVEEIRRKKMEKKKKVRKKKESTGVRVKSV